MRLSIIGAGAIGLTHCEAIAAVEGVEIAGIADPFPGGATLAARFGVTHHPDHRALLAAKRPDAAIIASPNETHLPIALDCLAAGVPVLVEKPLVNSLVEAETLLAAARSAGLPVLVGHHRRHHP
jgi:predicted dehydrogenase